MDLRGAQHSRFVLCSGLVSKSDSKRSWPSEMAKQVPPTVVSGESQGQIMLPEKCGVPQA